MEPGTKLIGTPVNRVDGHRKVTGAAQYAAEAVLPGMAHAVFVGSTVASGRIVRIGTSAAEQVPGVLLVLTHENRGPLAKIPAGKGMDASPAEPRLPLEDARVLYHGQFVAMAVAETLEEAHHAASLIQVEYERLPFAVAWEDAAATSYRPKQAFDDELQVKRGGPEEALLSAEVRVDTTYTSPNEHPCAMEPHATVASWSGGTLTVYNSTQWVQGDHTILKTVFGLPDDKVQVLAPFVGGMFGSKVAIAPHTLLAALASMQLGRPVKAVLSRTQVLTNSGHRTETVQRFELGATRGGKLVSMRHHTCSHTAVNGLPNDEEFHEPTNACTRLLYACPHYEATYEARRLHVMRPGWMRAPGEATGQWALECAMDELAAALQLDPVELRRRNHTDVDPHIQKPFSSKHLLTCYQQGAQRFGWERRTPEPRSMRDGDVLVGWGMATATHPGWLMGATVRVRLVRDGAGVRGVVSTAGIDVGTGMYTMMAIVAAEGLGLPLERITAELGDSRLGRCAPAGGSNLTASTAPAIMDACGDIRRQLLSLASLGPSGFERAGEGAGEFLFADGRLTPRAEPTQSIPYEELLSRSGRDQLEAEARTEPRSLRNDQYAFQSFGAHFVEVRVQPEIGRLRVSRVVSVFDVGRVMNSKAVRSQLIGGIVFGIGQALFEELTYDRVQGRAVNADLAGYLVPVHADVPDIDVSWLNEPDLNFNAMGCRGAGEIGITGTAAAIANALYHATGVRVRELPITPDKLL